MAIVAPISRWERRRPLVLALLCFLVAAWFAYDGWYGWPTADNAVYKKMLKPNVAGVDAGARQVAHEWPGWYHTKVRELVGSKHFVNFESLAALLEAHPSALAMQSRDFIGFDRVAHMTNLPGYHTITDIYNQRWIVLALGILGLLAVVWYVWVRRRRIEADDTGLTLANGMRIKWAGVTVIDNSRWADKGLVRIRYADESAQLHQAILDGTRYENLMAVLEALGEHSSQAQMVPPASAQHRSAQ